MTPSDVIDAAGAVRHEHTLLTILRDRTPEYVEATTDLGATWERFPLSEIEHVEILRLVHAPEGSYPLVRLILTKHHPTIAIAALRAHVRFLQNDLAHHCRSSADTQATQAPFTQQMKLMPRPDTPCRDVCATADGYYVSCLVWCAFLRDRP